MIGFGYSGGGLAGWKCGSFEEHRIQGSDVNVETRNLRTRFPSVSELLST